jgi:hypothetical protein
MKKNVHPIAKIALIAFLALQASFSFGQVVFTSTPDSIAAVNTLYTYQVTAAATPNAPTYSLQTAPAGMTIGASSGLVSWTPASMTAGGKVVIKAHNNAGDYFQTYYLYITNAIVCDADIISYWPLDEKIGTSVPELVHHYDGLWQGDPGPQPVIADDAMVGKSVKFDPTSNLDWGYNVTDKDQYEFSGVTQFSVSFWFKNQDRSITEPMHDEVFIGRWCGPASNNAGWAVKWNATTWKVEFYMKDNGYTDTTLVFPTEIGDADWHHVVATFYNGPDLKQKSYMHLFVDGVSSTLLYDFWQDGFSGNKDLTLGYYEGTAEPYSGLLDEVTVWKKELLEGDVLDLHSKGLSGQPVCAEGNVAPLITSDAITEATEKEAYSYTLTYRTIGTGVTLSAPVLPSWMAFNTTTGVLSGTPTQDNVGDNDVTLRVSQNGIDVDQAFTIAVANVNDPPAFTSVPVTEALSKTQYQYWITTNDPEDQAVTVTCPTKPAWLTFTTNNGSGLLQGTPTRDDVGNASVTLQASDGSVTTDQTFVIVVALDNHIPVVTSEPSTTGAIDELYTYTMVATDADGDALTYRSVSMPSWLAFNTSTQVLSGIPSQANVGTHNVELAVTDGKDDIHQSFTINVIPSGVNDKTGSLARVYPMPATDFVVFEFASKLDKADLQIFNTSGDLMKRVDISNLDTYRLDVTDLKPNHYLYRINTTKGQQSGPIIVK